MSEVVEREQVSEGDHGLGQPDRPKRSWPSRVRSQRAWVGRIIGGLVAIFLIWLICADPVAHVWYETHQEALRSNAAHSVTQEGSQLPRMGKSVAVIEDPAIGLNVVVAQGTSPTILRGAPGHLVGTPFPGAKGNSVVVGHARDWGAPFRNLAKLTVGSTLYLQAHPGVFKLPETGDFIYTVKSVTVAPASTTRFAAPTNDYRLTLVTNSGSRLGGPDVLVITAISGAAGRVTGPSSVSSLQPGRGALVENDQILLAILGLVACLAGSRILLRSHGKKIVVLVSVPLAALVMFSLFLEFDALFFRPLA
jgi:LPXTG-site transpeptidase (sortase) family protein